MDNAIIYLYIYRYLKDLARGGVMKGQIREIRIVDLMHYLALPFILVLAIWGVVLISCHWFSMISPWVFISVGALLTLFLLRNLLIGLVLLYKAVAPMSMRERCRFEPSCSTYMIMALQKYGLFVGLYKGLRRISRCHPPNGGEDLP